MRVRVTITDGVCSGGFHHEGDVVDLDWTTPEGMCLGAYMAVAPYAMAMLAGGSFDWETEDGAAMVHCPDPDGLTMELRRLPDE